MGKYIFGLGIFIVLLGSGGFAWMQYEESKNAPNYLQTEKKFSTSDTKKIKNKNKNLSDIPSIKKEVVLSLDFSCPYCRDFYKNSFAVLRKQYNTKIPFKISHYPLQTNGLGMEMAKFYECSLEQVDQWTLLDFLFFQLDEFDISKKSEWITALGIEPEPVKICEENPKTEKKILLEKEKAKEKGVQGTPTLFIGDTKFEGNTSKIKLEMEILKLLK